MGQMGMTDAGTTQDNFILPASPIGGLPISQDRLDRMKLVHDHTVPIFKKTHFRITIPIKGCSSSIFSRAWRHESESVKIINLDADAFLISSRALMIAKIS